jgi:hypothetical protein
MMSLGRFLIDRGRLSHIPGRTKVPEVVPGATEERGGKLPYALAHNLGLGGAYVVTILKVP